MTLAVFGWFGWSVLWLAPLGWSLIGPRLIGTPIRRGQGSIRLWLGSLLMVCASSALEATLRTNGVPGGRAMSAALSSFFGATGGILVMIAMIVLALPWLFGRDLSKLIGILRRSTPDAAGTARVSRLPPDDSRTDAPAMPRKPQQVGPNRQRRTAPWDPSLTRAIADPGAKPTMPARPRADNPPSKRTMAQWAEVEKIIPTPAMRSRMTLSQTNDLPKKSRDGEHEYQQIQQIQRTQTNTVRIIRTTPDGQTSIRVEHVSDAAILVEQVSGTQLGTSATVPTFFAPPDTEMVINAQGFHDDTRLINGTAPSFTPTMVTRSDPVLIDYIETTVSTSVVNPPDIVAPLVDTIHKPQYDDPSLATSSARQPSATQIAEDVVCPMSYGLDVDLPGLDLLDSAVADIIPVSAEWLAETGELIEQRLREFKVPVTVIGADAGPVITRFEVEPALGVRGSQIVGLMKDLSRALGMTSIRVVETIPGKTCMGLELPNAQRQMIRLSEILESPAYQQSASYLTLAMGKDITGNPLIADLARAPHMLVAGTTGSGKSVAINAMILSLLYKATPADVRLIMIDPKMLELSVYEGIPHLLAPVVTDMKLAANALSWCVTEMDKRYRLMSALGVRNLAGFNQKIRDGEQRERKVTNPFSLTPDAPEPLSTLPMIVVIIDELADLMMVAGKKIEELIARLAQKARAAGIHLILATQRPSVDVITGLIKANIPTRVAFQVSSKIDSRTILDQMGAEALLGHGDMLFLPPGSGYPQRVHGAFVSDEEVHRVVEFLKQFGEPEYEEAILAGVPSESTEKDLLGDTQDIEADPLYDEAVAYVVRSRRASISSVQRQLRVGYNRAARLVEQMEAAGILSSMATNGSRDVLAPPVSE